MKKNLSKRIQKRKNVYRIPRATPINRAWDLGIRLEHRRVRGKNRKRPGKEK